MTAADAAKEIAAQVGELETWWEIGPGIIGFHSMAEGHLQTATYFDGHVVVK